MRLLAVGHPLLAEKRLIPAKCSAWNSIYAVVRKGTLSLRRTRRPLCSISPPSLLHTDRPCARLHSSTAPTVMQSVPCGTSNRLGGVPRGTPISFAPKSGIAFEPSQQLFWRATQKIENARAGRSAWIARAFMWPILAKRESFIRLGPNSKADGPVK